MRFTSAHDAVAQLFALAQALTHDYDRFETLIEGKRERTERGGAAKGGSGARIVCPPLSLSRNWANSYKKLFS